MFIDSTTSSFYIALFDNEDFFEFKIIKTDRDSAKNANL
jgi:hypothetical protein